MKALIVLLLIGCVQSVFGQDDQLLELCQGIQQYRSEASESPRQLLLRTLKLRFFPSLYSKPLSTRLETLHHLQAPREPGKKNMVFFVGLPAELTQATRSFEPSFKALSRELQETSKKFSFLARTKSVAECVAQGQAHAVDFEHLKQLNQKIQSPQFQAFQRLRETDTFRKELRQLQGQLSSDWHARVVTHIADLHEALRSRDLANVVIVTHGKPSGHIIDSFDHQYPNGFFSDLSPSLYSLSFFNCYGAATLDTYDLKTKLAQSASFYRERLVTVAQAPTSAQADQVAPIRGFDSFMRSLDRRLQKRERALVKQANAPEVSTCELQVQSTSLQTSAALSLNGKFLGVLGSGLQVLRFPCEWRKEKGNLLQLSNISSLPWDLTQAPAIDGFEPQVFLTPEGSIRSVLYRDL